jgi:mono/diheme cytochrome c family protein
VLAGVACASGATEATILPETGTRPVDFMRDVKPILEASCVKCHGRGREEGGFRIDTRQTLLGGGEQGLAVAVGKSDESDLIDRVRGVDPDEVMPRKGSRLTPEQVRVLAAWIDQGLPWQEGFAFTRPQPNNLTARRPQVPAGLAAENPIDRFLKQYLDAHQEAARRPVGDRVYARRVYLDTIGLLPPPAELAAFIGDPRPDKRERLVDRLLGDNAGYAQNWLSFWNDLLRNDYAGTGYVDGGRKQITRWLYDALAANKPYDRFVGELVDPVPGTEGFSMGIVWRGTVNASQTPEMQAAQNICQVFMGTNLKCASCHDSFINDLTLSDAYGLAGVYAGRPLEMVRCDKPTGRTASLRFLYSDQLGTIDPAASRADRLARLAEVITQRKDGRLTRTIVNRLWQRFMGRGLIEPVDDMEQPAWSPEMLDWLAEDFADHGYDLRHLIRTILTSGAYQRPAVAGGDPGSTGAYVFQGPLVRRMSAEQFLDALAQVTGEGYAPSKAKFDTNQAPAKKDAPAPVAPASPAAWVRSSLVASDPLQTALGRPNREQVNTVRLSTPTTLEMLELTDGRQLADLIGRGARQLINETGGGPDKLVPAVYLKAFGRKPSRSERRLIESELGPVVSQAATEDFLWAVFMLPEFQLIY